MDALRLTIMWHIHDRNISMVADLKHVGHSSDVAGIIIEYAKIDYSHIWKYMTRVIYNNKLVVDRSDLMMIIFVHRFIMNKAGCMSCDIIIPHMHIELHSLLDPTTEIADYVCTYADILVCLELGDPKLMLTGIRGRTLCVFGQKYANDPIIAKNVQVYLDMISW